MRVALEMLYRAYDADDQLLYIGISREIRSRITKHSRSSRWWSLVARLEVSIYPDRETLEEAERTAIRTETPVFNVQYSKTRKPCSLDGLPPEPPPRWQAGMATPTRAEFASIHQASAAREANAMRMLRLGLDAAVYELDATPQPAAMAWLHMDVLITEELNVEVAERPVSKTLGGDPSCNWVPSSKSVTGSNHG